MTGEVLGAGIDFDAWNDPRVDDGLDEGRAILLLLADRLVVEYQAADRLAETRRR
jgi:hypothetical protein